MEGVEMEWVSGREREEVERMRSNMEEEEVHFSCPWLSEIQKAATENTDNMRTLTQHTLPLS